MPCSLMKLSIMISSFSYCSLNSELLFIEISLYVFFILPLEIYYIRGKFAE